MNLTTLQARCALRFQDPGFKIVDNPGWLGYLNDAYRDVINASPWWPFLEVLHDQSLVFTAGTRTMPLPATVLRVASVYNLTAQFKCSSIEGHTQHILRYPDQTETGPIQRYRIIGSDMQVWPLPDTTTTLTIDYWSAPADLAAGGDVPAFPAQWHNALVEGALARAYIDDGALSQAAAYQTRFDLTVLRMVRDLHSGQQDRNPEIVDDWFS